MSDGIRERVKWSMVKMQRKLREENARQAHLRAIERDAYYRAAEREAAHRGAMKARERYNPPPTRSEAAYLSGELPRRRTPTPKKRKVQRTRVVYVTTPKRRKHKKATKKRQTRRVVYVY
jgi:hypothetical protein